jgi:hypoxanthine phosphoribosyltransferase
MKTLYTQKQIEFRIIELAKEIDKAYEGKIPYIICTLIGAKKFCSKLLPLLNVAYEYDEIKLKSYGGTKAGEILYEKEPLGSWKGKDVLLIEDIVDTGNTMVFALEKMKSANSVKICTLLDKPEAREVKVEANFIGFVLEGKPFVVGYGLDYNEKFREFDEIKLYED